MAPLLGSTLPVMLLPVMSLLVITVLTITNLLGIHTLCATTIFSPRCHVGRCPLIRTLLGPSSLVASIVNVLSSIAPLPSFLLANSRTSCLSSVHLV